MRSLQVYRGSARRVMLAGALICSLMLVFAPTAQAAPIWLSGEAPVKIWQALDLDDVMDFLRSLWAGPQVAERPDTHGSIQQAQNGGTSTTQPPGGSGTNSGRQNFQGDGVSFQ